MLSSVSVALLVYFIQLCYGKNIVVIGGSGRVGGSGLRSIYSRFENGYGRYSSVGRSVENWLEYKSRYKIDESISFIALDFNDELKLSNLIKDYDVVVNTAGPFQGLERSVVLETCLKLGKKYIDVCDDIRLSQIVRSKDYQRLACENNATAIIATGIWPGGSSLLCQELVYRVGGHANVDKVTFSFFTAGSGGAGKTILTATFLILGENVLTYVNGEPLYRKSATNKVSVDFGKGIGHRDVVRLNLIECESCFSSGIKNVETFFGTAPPLWNSLFALFSLLIPQSILQNRNLMTALAGLSLPLVRLIDTLVGSTNGIRVDLTTKAGNNHYALLTHHDMEEAVGISIAAFVAQLIDDNEIPCGVYFPEEIPGIKFRQSILNDISRSAISYEYSC